MCLCTTCCTPYVWTTMSHFTMLKQWLAPFKKSKVIGTFQLRKSINLLKYWMPKPIWKNPKTLSTTLFVWLYVIAKGTIFIKILCIARGQTPAYWLNTFVHLASASRLNALSTHYRTHAVGPGRAQSLVVCCERLMTKLTVLAVKLPLSSHI